MPSGAFTSLRPAANRRCSHDLRFDQIGGAVLGGLLLGPLGMVMGAGAGSSLGSGRRAEEELEALGLDRAVVAEARALAASLADAQEAQRAADAAREGVQRRCFDLEAAAEGAYADAKR